MKTAVQKKIRAYVDSKGIKRSHIASASGIDRRALSDIMCCRRELRADEYMKICEALEVEPNEFYTKIE